IAETDACRLKNGPTGQSSMLMRLLRATGNRILKQFLILRYECRQGKLLVCIATAILAILLPKVGICEQPFDRCKRWVELVRRIDETRVSLCNQRRTLIVSRHQCDLRPGGAELAHHLAR